ncbi:MAG: hypothetical protein U5L05_16010 [Rubrivivax sp.]|nr:hypothetical protein [Rubrivivax sp.]
MPGAAPSSTTSAAPAATPLDLPPSPAPSLSASDAARPDRAHGLLVLGSAQPGYPEAYLLGAPVELNKTDWVKTAARLV